MGGGHDGIAGVGLTLQGGPSHALTEDSRENSRIPLSDHVRGRRVRRDCCSHAHIVVPGDAAATADNIRASATLFRVGFVIDLV
jgi:hypothetical protein